MPKYSIKTEVCGNPDYGQDPRKPPYGVVVKTLKADTFQELSDAVRDWIGDNDIGGGNWQNPQLLIDGQVIGYMSYNGKVWADKSWSPETRQIYFYKETV
jgi:hypothetical protein